MTLAEYNHWLAVAGKYSRRTDEAGDVLQDALLIAVNKGRLDFSLEENRRWFSGVLRNRAAMIARTEARRRKREGEHATDQETSDMPKDNGDTKFLERFPPAARKLAGLMLHGMTRSEIMFVLSLSETAFRQRLTTIRKVLSGLSPELRAEATALAYYRDAGDASHLEFGLVRRALLQGIRLTSEIGTHDPDGHLLLIRSTVSEG